MGIIVKNVPVKAHHSIRLVERYHGPLRCVYSIITKEIPGISPELAMQMSLKALNNFVGPNGLIPTLLVFGAYPQMVEMDASSPTITQRTIVMEKAMEEVRKSIASRQVNNALNTWNGPSTTLLHDLPLKSLVLVYRKDNASQSGSWKGPYKLLSLEGKSAVVELQSGPTRFRSIIVKLYYKTTLDNAEVDTDTFNPLNNQSDQDVYKEKTQPDTTIDQNVPLESSIVPPVIPSTIPNTRSHTRLRVALANTNSDTTYQDDAPKLPIAPHIVSARQGRGRPRKYPIYQANLTQFPDHCFVMISTSNITTGCKLSQFTASRQKEITGLLEKSVFKIINHQSMPLLDICIFNSRFVDEIKNPGTDKSYEKSRLVIQSYNDLEKSLVLTQSPTI